ncbi:hypothetical protein [Trichlorobacter lovleyi]|uniref:hypothetical protein n=1 Tax=Trichlorobacter lovleyi TaxID=313985 RepID=UPI00224043F1|nr:hypothetical protein [Trichlorobacter lovleyi]
MRKISKFLSLVLQHRPDAIGITLDSAGRMHAEGFKFYRSASWVWLTERVPRGYVT